jgi:hypothetical protein
MWLRTGTTEFSGSCEHGYETSGSTKKKRVISYLAGELVGGALLRYGVSLRFGVCIAHLQWGKHMDICSKSELKTEHKTPNSPFRKRVFSKLGTSSSSTPHSHSQKTGSGLLRRTSIYFNRT